MNDRHQIEFDLLWAVATGALALIGDLKGDGFMLVVFGLANIFFLVSASVRLGSFVWQLVTRRK